MRKRDKKELRKKEREREADRCILLQNAMLHVTYCGVKLANFLEAKKVFKMSEKFHSILDLHPAHIEGRKTLSFVFPF